MSITVSSAPPRLNSSVGRDAGVTIQSLPTDGVRAVTRDGLPTDSTDARVAALFGVPLTVATELRASRETTLAVGARNAARGIDGSSAAGAPLSGPTSSGLNHSLPSPSGSGRSYGPSGIA